MDFYIVYKTFSYLLLVSSGVAFFISLRAPFKFYPSLKFLLACSFLADGSFRILLDFFGHYLALSTPLYNVAEILLVSFFYYYLLDNKSSKRVIQIIVVILIFLLLTFQFGTNAVDVNKIKTLSNVIFSAYGILYFIQFIRKQVAEDPLQVPSFWFNSSLLLYFSGSLFVFMIFDPLVKQQQASAILSYDFHNFLGVVKNLGLSYGFILCRRTVYNFKNG